MWIIVDLLALTGLYNIGSWTVRVLYGSDGEDVPVEQPAAPPAAPKPVEIKAKRQPRKRKP